ncbi:MAG: peroxiredoxin family protein [Candidatus Polarisedimenticolia bacterium]
MPLAAGSKAPAFVLPRAGGGDLEFPPRPARPALLTFYKDECPTCRYTFPFLQRLHEQVGDRALVMGVSQDDGPRAEAWAADLGLTFPIAVDGPGYPVSSRYGLVVVPTLFLVGADGRLARVEEAFLKDAMSGLAEELAARAGAPPPALYRPGEEIPALKPG